MKKLVIAFVAICTVLIPNFSAKATVKEVSSDKANAWGFSASNPKTNITSKFKIKNNDEYKFQYVDIPAATEIYEHGATFCRMQLQHNYGEWKVFIESSSCKTICQNGYYGNDCSSQNSDDDYCENDSLKQHFINTQPVFGPNATNIDGFYNHKNDTILLTIYSVDEHSVTIRPIEFYGNDEKGTKIQTINTRGDTLVLCAPGYEKNTSGQCVKASYCNNTPSDGEDDPTSTGCGTGKAYEDDTYTNCITCGNDIHSGVLSNGICKKCGTQMFKNNGCHDYKTYSKLEMRVKNTVKCWMETDKTTYSNCVKGTPGN